METKRIAITEELSGKDWLEKVDWLYGVIDRWLYDVGWPITP